MHKNNLFELPMRFMWNEPLERKSCSAVASMICRVSSTAHKSFKHIIVYCGAHSHFASLHAHVALARYVSRMKNSLR